MSNTYSSREALQDYYYELFQSGITAPRASTVAAMFNAVFDQQPQFKEREKDLPKEVVDSFMLLEEILSDWDTGVCYYSFIISITKLTLL